MNFKTFLTDAAHVNSPVAGVIALVTIGDVKDVAVIFSVIVGTICTAVVTVWKIKNNKKD